MTVELIEPSRKFLPGYQAALERGWASDNLRSERKRQEDLARIAADPDLFVASFNYSGQSGELTTLPDGTKIARLPRIGRWLWDGEFCGQIECRWQEGTAALPPTCLGHIGYSVVPWKEKRGYATEALRLVLAIVKERLPYVDVTTEPDNVASQRVVLANGGHLVEEFIKPPMFGGTQALRFRINLAPS